MHAGQAVAATLCPMRTAEIVFLAVAAHLVADALEVPSRLPYFATTPASLLIDGSPVQLRGVSWFGFEGEGAMVDGLYYNSMSHYVAFLRAHGFNALRVPLAMDLVGQNLPLHADMVNHDPVLSALPSARYFDGLDRLVSLCAEAGILVMLDVHRLESTVWPDPRGLWYRGSPAAADVNSELLDAWETLLPRYCGQWNFFAADLFNEPWGATWGGGEPLTDWRAAATVVAERVLALCPRIIVVVEGVGNQAGEADGESKVFWGENLRQAAERPLRLSLPSKVALSPHVYGPGQGHAMEYFEEADFPRNMPKIWDEHFRSAAASAGHLLLIGEWGGVYADRGPKTRNKAWMDAFQRCVHTAPRAAPPTRWCPAAVRYAVGPRHPRARP